MSSPVHKFVIDGVNRTSGIFSKVRSDLFSVKKIALGAGAGLGALAAGVTAAAASWATFTNRMLKADDSIQKTAIMLGTSTENLTEFQHVADQSGVAYERFVSAVRIQSDRLNQALAGKGDATFYLKQLRLDVRALLQEDPIEAFAQIAQKLNSIENPAQRTAIAMRIWGKSGGEMVQIANNGADGIAKLRQEANDLGIVLDQRLANAAATTVDNIDRLTKRMKGQFLIAVRDTYPALAGLAGTIDSAVIPALKRMVRWSSKATVAGLKIALGTVQMQQALGKLPLMSRISPINDYLNDLGEIEEALKTALGSIYLARTGFDQFASSAKKTKSTILTPVSGLTFPEQIAAMFKELRESDPAYGLSMLATNIERARRELGKIYTTGELDALFDFFEKKLQPSIVATANESQTLSERVRDMFREMQDADPGVGLSRAIADIEAARKELGEFYSTAQLDALVDYFAKKFPASVEISVQSLSGFALRVQDSIQNATTTAFDAFEDFLVTPSKRAMGELLEDWTTLLKRMVARIATAKIAEALAKAINGYQERSGKGGGWLSTVVGYISSAVGSYAGNAATPTTATPTTPTGGGKVAPVGRGVKGGGGGGSAAPVFTFTYAIDARGADAGVEQRITKAMEETRARTIADVSGMLRNGMLTVPRAAIS